VTRAGIAAAALGLALAGGLGGCGSDAGGTGPAANTIAAVSGDNQSAAAGGALPAPLVVVVESSAGAPVAGASVAWAVVSGDATVAPPSGVTDANGHASATVTLGTASAQIRASIAGGASVAFNAAIAGAATATLVAQVPVPANYGIHDTFVRDGLAFTCEWNTGLVIYDVGNGIKGGSPANPVEVGRVVTSVHNPTATSGSPQPSVHNSWWFHNPVTGEQKYVFVGEEGPANIGGTATGDIHVIDVSDLTTPKEVAFFHLPAIAGDSAGTHNFWMDEPAQILYAAYYDGGIIALDVSGTLSGDLSSRLLASIRPGGAGNTYTWGVQLYNGDVFASDMLSGFWRLHFDPAAKSFSVVGGGNNVPERFSSDLWVANGYAYTGTWGGVPRTKGVPADVIKVWQVAGAAALVDSVTLAGVGTVSDDEVSSDGKYLLATAERGTDASKGFYLLSLVNPAHPVLSSFVPVPDGTGGAGGGLHTGTFATIGGHRYVFAARNPPNPALMIWDVTAVTP
jgi:hypothetical protein